MKSRKGFINIAIIVIATLVIGAAGYFAIVKNKKPILNTSQPNATSTEIMVPSASSTVADLSMWKTYRDGLFGFEFKYPNNLSRRDSRNGNCFEDGAIKFCVESYVTATGVLVEKWVDESYENRHQSYYGYTKKEISIAGHNAIQLVRPSNRANINNQQPSTSAIIVGHGQNLMLEFSGEAMPQEMFSSITFFAPGLDFTPYELDVSWNAAPIEEPETKEELESRSCIEGESYIVGTINNGTFKGDKIASRNQQFCGMDCGGLSENEFNYYVDHGSRSIYVGKDVGYKFKELGTPDEIRIPNSSYVLKKQFASGFLDKEEIKLILFESSNVGKVYETTYNDCTVVERQDHAQMYYSLDIPFINKENGEINITLLNGTKLHESYDLDSDWTCLPVASQKFDEGRDLTKVGQNDNSEPFFVLKDQQSEELKNIYNDENTMARYQKTMPSTYQGFLDTYPLLYWKDPFGRWIVLQNKRYLRAAEKCKPVIYLYPQEEMNVSVYVEPNGGFVKTIPEYNDGWHVIAHPNGTIIDNATKKEYPYLYWSGWSVDIPRITKGWVVEQRDVERFLEGKLAILGLNKKEITDFNEYWVTRLNEDGSPYFKIMFLDQRDFNNLAPLRVEGEKRPDHVIRVIMYAQGTAGREALPLQILPPPPSRDGFTVVEWGGSLLK